MNIGEMIAVLTAFKNGKDIELDINQNWFSIPENYNKWDFVNHTYRIAPEPKLVPFDYNDDLVGKVVKDKSDIIKELIIIQATKSVILGNSEVTYQGLLDYYTFLDGKPCGKYE